MLDLKQTCIKLLEWKFGKENIKIEDEYIDIRFNINQSNATSFSEIYLYLSPPKNLKEMTIRWLLTEGTDGGTKFIRIDAYIIDCESVKRCGIVKHFSTMDSDSFITSVLANEMGVMTYNLIQKELTSKFKWVE